MLPAVGHALQPIGVLGRDRRGRDLRRARDRSSARRCAASAVPAGRRSGPAPRPRRARPRATARGAIAHRLAVGRERHVEEDDLALGTLRPAASSSSKLRTTSSSASTPSAGVPTLLPRPSITSAWRRGATISRLSWPRTQCGTLTGSLRTFSRPSFFICATAQSIAPSSACEPLSRWPKVSPSSASRCQANPRRQRFAEQPRGRIAMRIEPGFGRRWRAGPGRPVSEEESEQTGERGIGLESA